MGFTINTKGNLLLMMYVDDPAHVDTKLEKPVLMPKWTFFVVCLMGPYTFLTTIVP